MEGVIDTRIQERFCFGLKTLRMGSLAAGGLWWGAETAFIDPTARSSYLIQTFFITGKMNGINPVKTWFTGTVQPFLVLSPPNPLPRAVKQPTCCRNTERKPRLSCDISFWKLSCHADVTRGIFLPTCQEGEQLLVPDTHPLGRRLQKEA